MRKLRRIIVSLCGALFATAVIHAANPGGVGLEAAREQLKTLTVGEGLEATLFACEPMVLNPADMDIDARGRIWVTEGANYRTFQKWGKLRPEGDRIVILEDTNGDGLADKATTFYQGNDINTALGICVLGNKVIVSCAPNVFVLTDTDGDDKADKKEVLFTGISGVDHDHAIHAFNFGPDGKLYFNFGNAGGQLKRPDGSPVKDREGREINSSGKPFRQGMVFRCNIDGSEVEVLANNFRNNYEVCVDSLGTMWQSDNDDDGNRGVRINYVMDYGNYGYTDEMTGKNWGEKRTNMEKDKPEQHWHLNDPGVVPNLLQTGNGSPTGILFYEGNMLPSIFRHSIIHCDAGPRVVRSYTIKQDGAGYQASIVNILTTTNNDSWFRPSDVCTAPDGSIYVADWNDAGVGGHYMADQKLETMSGRVYRVAPKGNKQLLPVLDLKSMSGLVDALRSPNNATRYLAWTKLHEMQNKAEDFLTPMWRGDPDPYQRARAFELLARIPGQGAKYVAEAVKDKNPDIRNLALRFARVEKIDTAPLVKRLSKDKSPEVRRECALSLRHNQSSDAPDVWATLAQQHDGKDRWYLEALGIGADQQEDKFFDAWLQRVGNNWNTPAGRDIIWRSRSRKSPALLVKIITDKNTPEAEKPRYIRALDFIKGPEKDAALLELVTAP